MVSRPPLVPGLPEKTQILEEKGARYRRTSTPRVVRRLWFLRRSWRLFWQGLSAPFFSSGALFGFVSIPFFLFFVFVLLGIEGVMNESMVLTAGGLALIATIPVWAVLNLIAAPLRQWRAQSAEGRWIENRFLLHQRKHLFTCEWSPSDNGSPKEFAVPFAPLDAAVEYSLEIEGPAHLIQCLVVGRFYFWPIVPLLELWRPALRGKVRLRNGRKLRLYCQSSAGTLPIIVRVYALAWDIRPATLFEYTDTRINATIAVSSENDRYAKEA